MTGDNVARVGPPCEGRLLMPAHGVKTCDHKSRAGDALYIPEIIGRLKRDFWWRGPGAHASGRNASLQLGPRWVPTFCGCGIVASAYLAWSVSRWGRGMHSRRGLADPTIRRNPIRHLTPCHVLRSPQKVREPWALGSARKKRVGPRAALRQSSPCTTVFESQRSWPLSRSSSL